MVSAGNVVGSRDVVGLARSDGGGPIADAVAVQQAQREQAEVGLVAPVDQAQIGVEVSGIR